MLKTLPLVLPILFPSWRFFKTIDPSPRVQWAIWSEGGKAPTQWHDFRPCPNMVTPLQMMLRLFWNAKRNDTLFVISCAEKIQEQPTPNSIAEIRQRVQGEIMQLQMDTAGHLFQFRLVFVHREQMQMVQDIVFVSDISPVTSAAPC